MKLIKRFSRIFDKSYLLIGGIVFLGSIFPFVAYGALDVTVTVASKTNTSATLAVKNNVVATTGADGQYRDSLAISVSVVRTSDQIVVSQIPEFFSRGKETKNVTISSLSPGTSYEAMFSIYNRTTGEKTSITTPFATTGTFVAPTTNIPLPVEFLKDKTLAQANQITLTVSNKATETIHVQVFALGSTGSVVGSAKEADVPAGGTAILSFSEGITRDTTYDFRMNGKKLTDTNYNRYVAVDYKGVKTPKITLSTGGQSGGTTSGQTASVATKETSKTLTGATSVGDGTCGDGRDNDGDGKRDWDGVALGGIPQFQPDPSCVNPSMTEEADVVAKNSWIPCTNKCDLPNVIVLINSLIEKLITVILFPIAVLMFMYAGYKYITAQGNPSEKANIKKMIGNLILGIIIILTSWVVVQTALRLIGYTDSLFFF